MKPLLQAAALLAATGLAGAAICEPLEPMPGAPGGHGPAKVMVIVSSHGLNLSTAAGADVFLHRLDAAIDQACKDRPTNHTLAPDRSPQFRACRAKAREAAMAYVGSPTVRQRYDQRFGHAELSLANR